MAVKKISADRIFDGENFLAPQTVLVVDEKNKVIDLVPETAAGPDVKKLKGILTPGLINAHCHLELSHFKSSIPAGGGLVRFLLQVVAKRKEPWSPQLIQEKAALAIAEMHTNGIVAVGDICNTTDVIAVKKQSRLQWRNFVEVLNFSDATLESRINHNQQVLDSYVLAGLGGSGLTAHAPYSVTPATFAAINKATAGGIISVHNQETKAEDQLFHQGNGDFLQLYALTGTRPLGPSGWSSLQTWLPYFTNRQTILLVHNTYTNQDDIRFAQKHAAAHGLRLVWCLCPNANNYIENNLPPLDLLVSENCSLVLGTDSYSSNWQLNIAAEIKLLADAFPDVALETLLGAATKNGAEAFGWDDLGVIKKDRPCSLALLHTNEKGALTGTSERVY